MKKLHMIIFLIGFVLAGCAGADWMPSVLATPSMGFPNSSAVTRVTATANSTPTADEVSTAYAVIAFDQATSTARAAATSTAVVVTSTAEAKATDQFWVGVTLQVATQQATQTQVAGTQIAGTQQAANQTAVPLTETALAATQTVEQQELYAEVASIWIWRVGLALFIVGLLIVGVMAIHRLVPFVIDYLETKSLQAKTTALRPDEHGRFGLVPVSILKNDALINPNLSTRAITRLDQQDDLSPAQSLENTNSYRELDKVREISNSSAAFRLMKSILNDDVRKAGPKFSGVAITKPEKPETEPMPLLPMTPALPPLPTPHYKMLYAWDGNMLPYGVDEDENLMLVDPTRRPHMLVTGDTGSGKTRSAIRTLASGALVSGWNVLAIGKGIDFMPFEEHSNFKMINVNVSRDAARYVQILRTLAEQMDIRDQILMTGNTQATTWAGYGQPQTMIILDDFAGAMFRMDRATRTEVLNEAKAIAMDGRKYGLNLVIGLQRASHTSIDTDLRSQMGRIVYRVASSIESRMALDETGAERLPPLNFLSRLSDDASIQRGAGFFLQDGEVIGFLRSRPVSANEPMEWIDAVSVDVESVSEPVSGGSATVSDNLLLDEAQAKAEEEIRIRDAYLARISAEKKFSLSDIERDVFGKRGGSYHNAVKRVISRIENCEVEDVASIMAEKLRTWEESATATATSPNMPDFEANPA